jgi:hypothetical protein
MFRVQLPLGCRKQTVDDEPVLQFRCRLGETTEVPGRIEIRDACAFDEHLLDIAPGEQLAQRPEVRDRAEDAFHHLVAIGERALVTRARSPLVCVDRTFDLMTHFAKLRGGLEPPLFDRNQRVPSDRFVRVDGG